MDNKIELGWLAGIIEGEGCFSINKAGNNRKHFVLSISITNTDFILLNKCNEILNENGITSTVRREKAIVNHKPRFDLMIGGIGNMINLIEKVLPFMFSQKKVQAELMLNFLKRRFLLMNNNCGKSWRKIPYGEIDYSYLRAMQSLKSISESVETGRLSSHVDDVTVRTARICKGADQNRNDFGTRLN